MATARQPRMIAIALACVAAIANAHDVIVPQFHRPNSAVHVESVEASVDINNQLAVTTLEITVRNTANTRGEGQVVMPVPAGAAISYFKLDGIGGDDGARLLPRDEAREIYEGIVRRMQDPAILEFLGTACVRSQIFPIEANSTRTITLRYEQLLESESGRIDYSLPRSASLEPSRTAWTVTARIRDSRPIAAIWSPGHRLDVRGDSTHDRRVKILNASAPGSIRLVAIAATSRSELAATVLAAPDLDPDAEQGGTMLLLLAPPAADDRPFVPRELTIVLDRSGSMRGKKLAQAVDAAAQVIAALKPGERFNIVDYADNVERFAPEAVVVNDETIAEAEAYLRGIKAIGGTNIHDALTTALGTEPAEGSLPIVLFLTDGLPTVGITDEVRIREAIKDANAHERRIFSFGLGFDVNAPLLTALASQSRGDGEFVTPDEDIEASVGRVFARLDGPVLERPSMRTVGGVRFFERLPRDLPDIFEGQQLIVTARYIGKTASTIVVEGEVLGERRVFEVPFDPKHASVEHAFVSRLWATRRIAELIEQVRQSGATSGELVDEIVRLSLTYGVMTEYTAFLADEDAGRVDLAGAVTAGTELLRERAIATRAGRGAVNQSMNLDAMQDAAMLSSEPQRFLDADMNEVEITQVRQLADRAMFRRDGRWVQGELAIASEDGDTDPKADEVVAFGTPRYFEIAAELAASNRQSMIAQRGELLLLVGGKRVLVENPG